MISILFHLAFTAGLLWYQRKQEFRPNLWALAGLWYLVSDALALIETTALTGRWFSGMFLQSLIVAAFYVPAIYFALSEAKRWKRAVWKSFILFLVFALVSTLAAAVVLANVPAIQTLSAVDL